MPKEIEVTNEIAHLHARIIEIEAHGFAETGARLRVKLQALVDEQKGTLVNG